jgi:hypothetical protein
MDIDIPTWGDNYFQMYYSKIDNLVGYKIFLTKINYLALQKFICNIVKKYRIKKITNLLNNIINNKINKDTIKYITEFIL